MRSSTKYLVKFAAAVLVAAAAQSDAEGAQAFTRQVVMATTNGPAHIH